MFLTPYSLLISFTPHSQDWDVDDYVIDLFSYFTHTCYTSFDPSDRFSFYTVYSEAFLDVDDMERDSGVFTAEAKQRRRRRGKKNRWRRWKNKKGQATEGPSMQQEEETRREVREHYPRSHCRRVRKAWETPDLGRPVSVHEHLFSAAERPALVVSNTRPPI